MMNGFVNPYNFIKFPHKKRNHTTCVLPSDRIPEMHGQNSNSE